MPVISYDFSLRINTFQEFASRLVIRILWYELAMNSKVKAGFDLCYKFC